MFRRRDSVYIDGSSISGVELQVRLAPFVQLNLIRSKQLLQKSECHTKLINH